MGEQSKPPFPKARSPQKGACLTVAIPFPSPELRSGQSWTFVLEVPAPVRVLRVIVPDALASALRAVGIAVGAESLLIEGSEIPAALLADIIVEGPAAEPGRPWMVTFHNHHTEPVEVNFMAIASVARGHEKTITEWLQERRRLLMEKAL